MTGPLRVALLGGVPPALGGGGLERQMQRTAEGLQRLGHTVVDVDDAVPFDVLHAFGAEPDNWHRLGHWNRNLAPLVLTPIVVVSPGRQERLLRLAARVPGLMTSTRMKRDLISRADATIAGTAYEGALLRSAFGAKPDRLHVIGNGADPPSASGTLPDGVPPRGYLLMLGVVSARKGQAAAVEALSGVRPVVVAGGFSGTSAEKAHWEATVQDSGAIWLGQVDARTVDALLAAADALVHLSSAEVQSLAVLEALAAGVPVIASDIPSHRELRDAHGDWVRIAAGPAEVARAAETLGELPAKRPDVPTWTDIAGRLESIYAEVLGASRAASP